MMPVFIKRFIRSETDRVDCAWTSMALTDMATLIFMAALVNRIRCSTSEAVVKLSRLVVCSMIKTNNVLITVSKEPFVMLIS